MTQQFTASEVRDEIAGTQCAIDNAGFGSEGRAAFASYAMDNIGKWKRMLRAYADRLEADEKAVPVMVVNHVSSAEHDLPIGMKLYAHPSPSDAERLAEALEIIDGWMELYDHQGTGSARDASRSEKEWAADRAKLATLLAAHSAKTQPQTDELHPATADLVDRFADALRDKLLAAQRKYGYSDNWQRSDWMNECRQHLREHLEKGDPRDVAAYCAFLWHHGAPTVANKSQTQLRAECEAAAPQPHAAEPVYQYQATPDSWVDCDYDLYNASGDPKRVLYTHPQPAQDAKDAATIERVARAIYEHVFTMSIPRMGVRSATFEEVWAIPSERERLTAQACAAIDAAMAKESGR